MNRRIKNISAKRHINFRQWSRKGYAVFLSLGKVVRIATLKLAVSDRLNEKSVSYGLDVEKVVPSFDFDDVECEISILEKILIETGLIINPVSVKISDFELISTK